MEQAEQTNEKQRTPQANAGTNECCVKKTQLWKKCSNILHAKHHTYRDGRSKRTHFDIMIGMEETEEANGQVTDPKGTFISEHDE